MLTLAEAQTRLLAATRPLPAETLPLAAAANRVLAASLTATRTQPPFAASAMDGYAIRYADLPGPWTLAGTSAAGARHPAPVAPHTCVRILTGAPLPDGADTVVVQEDITRDGDTVRLTGDGPDRPGAHVRRAGLDFAAGDVVLHAGDRLTPARLGLAAAAGHAGVAVHRRPRVALLSTGDELVPPGHAPGPDQIVETNGVTLAALFAPDADIVSATLVPDDLAAIEAAIDAARDADLLVTIGGASVGDRDLVLPALEARGAAIDFWKVAIRPGKPVLTGTLGAQRVVGLPGNPVSAFVCAHLFVRPLLRAMAGDPSPLPRTLVARVAVALAANGPRQDHMRAVLALADGALVATPAAVQDSSMLATLAAANALIVRPPHAEAVDADGDVPVMPLDIDWSPA